MDQSKYLFSLFLALFLDFPLHSVWVPGQDGLKGLLQVQLPRSVLAVPPCSELSPHPALTAGYLVSLESILVFGRFRFAAGRNQVLVTAVMGVAAPGDKSQGRGQLGQ